MLNITAVGRLGKDPELRTIPKGPRNHGLFPGRQRLCQGRATDRLAEVLHLGQAGETFAQYVRKGSQVTISGKLFEDEWVNKDGETVKDICVDVQDFSLPPREQPQQQAAPALDVAEIPF